MDEPGGIVQQEEVSPPERRGGILSRLPFVSGEPKPPAALDELIKAVREYNSKADLRVIQRAYEVAERAHRGQVRKSGDPFISHPLGVARILADLGMDTTTIVAALLHDVVEDTDVAVGDLREEFGPEVAAIVDGLTKLERIEFRTKEHQQAENVRKMIIAMARDIRVLVIKLADRLHNMRTLGALSREKQDMKATETLEIYAPLAHRLGIFQIKWELEDLAFATLHPKRFVEIENLVGKAEDERKAYLDGVVDKVGDTLRKIKIKHEIKGRPKHLYSVYEKMVLRGKEFLEIYDLVGIRILVDTVKDCYGALGAIHALWKPVPGRFKDYIAMPKFNMYQSLHTTVIGPEGRPLEVQIRTRQMHRTAEYGIAAHWRYKEGGKKKDEADLAWLAQMLDWQKETTDPQDFMESLRIDLYTNQVFAFTPKGDVISLPAEATPLDFAYTIHTEVGHRCTGAKVNGKLVPLDYQLQTGDTVDIITSKAQDAGPKRDWLQIVRSPRARNKIKQWFSRERREDAMDSGRELLQRELRRQGLPLKRLTTEELLVGVAEELNFASLDAMLVGIGEGHVSPQSVVVRLTRTITAEDEEAPQDLAPKRPVRIAPRESTGVVVAGSSDVWVKLARCCTPVPGDAIVGFVTRGHGVSVHRRECPNARSLLNEPDRMIDVSWREGTSTTFVVSIQVEALDRKKLLGDVATVISDAQVNILEASTNTGKDRIARFRFTFELADIAHLDSILRSVRRVDGVFDARRIVPG
ncbi:MAG TPA: bifunctional (p)ppGpp synthetase/guanosine-3',5'-bis(diphosphate) 3'-pyrophosphohydrolase [Actinomycetota bacterium]|nr:bifunctional (p)ppGpp synthetase/guanosine-3',5'-bis(diphosphate) 3'-pyrophosphohydrolase [Actinomycetota bacterium]